MISKTHVIENMNVIYNININIEELLAGSKRILNYMRYNNISK
jgi:hypothetical protein